MLISRLLLRMKSGCLDVKMKCFAKILLSLVLLCAILSSCQCQKKATGPNTNAGSCNVTCLTVIGVVIGVFLLSIPSAILMYYFWKFVFKTCHTYQLMRKDRIQLQKGMSCNGNCISARENGIPKAGTGCRVHNSITMLEIIEEVPEKEV